MLAIAVLATLSALAFPVFWKSRQSTLNRVQPRKDREPGAIDVVLVVIDTARADFTNPYGEKHPTTPFLSELARQGVTFTNMFSVAPWTVPAMYSMITGLYPSEHGIVRGIPGRGNLEGGGQQVLPNEAFTLAERLGAAGYTTFGVCTNYHLRPKFGFAQGFDYFVGRNFSSLPFPNLAVSSLAGLIRSEPKYFLWLHYLDPHYEYRLHAPWFGRWNDSKFSSYSEIAAELVFKYYREYKGLSPEAPVAATDIEFVTHVIDQLSNRYTALFAGLSHYIKPSPNDNFARFMRAAYKSELRKTDEALRQAFTTLRIDDNTLVVITSDHGEEIFEHGKFGHRTGALYQELLQVPLIILLPGRESSGTVIDTPVSTVDILPTILSLLGQSVPEDIPGKSLLPLIEGEEFLPRPLYAEFENPDARAMLEYPWKYIRNYPDKWEKLYNLSLDPRETNNLCPHEKPRCDNMRRRLGDWSKSIKPRWSARMTTDLSPEEIQQLRQMGYLQ